MMNLIGWSAVGKLPIYRFSAKAPQEERTRVLIVGGVHPREWQALSAVRHMLRRILDSGSGSAGSLPGRCVWGAHTRVDLVLMLNPDGFELTLRQ